MLLLICIKLFDFLCNVLNNFSLRIFVYYLCMLYYINLLDIQST